jgi:hypothetical protein
MLLTPNPAGGADVRWTGSFIEGLPGTGPVMLIFLRGVVRFLARRLVKAAERDWSTPASLGAAFLRPQPSGATYRDDGKVRAHVISGLRWQEIWIV